MAHYVAPETPYEQHLAINIRTATPPCNDTESAWYGKPTQPGPLSPITDADSSTSDAAGPTYSPVDSLAPAMPNVSFAPAPDWLSPHSLDPRLPGPSARRNRSVSDPPPCSPQDNYPPMGRARASTVTNRIPFPEPQIPGSSLRSDAHNAPYLPNPSYPTMGPSPYPSLRQQPQQSMAYANLGGLYYPPDDDLTPTNLYPESSAMPSRTGVSSSAYGILPSNDAMTPTFDNYAHYPNVATPSPMPPWNMDVPAPSVVPPSSELDVDGVAQTTTWFSRFDLSSRSSSASSMRQPAPSAHGYNDSAAYAGGASSSSGLVEGPSRTATKVERGQIGTEAMTRKSDQRRKHDAKFHCPKPGCLKSFTRSHNLRNHLRSHEQKKAFPCPMCALRFNNPGVRDYHKKRCRGAASREID
ncbi:uncharacterized protein SCHCODRAFT_02519062 [Schizophyllum commune H4-8]|nr:uncharacterized protein SCHCODRAFT_02519062 [Schizophyllum commune H4-8]KAI5885872.1 hypothetical protein SCHCODRAFT_02519062 [Schizophyllum commune H4-8]